MEHQLSLFWSYAHADDQSDRGRVLTLAEHVRAEFALTTGNEVRLFVDREGIRWGDDWRARIDGALTSSTFFVPILSPRYFQRPECRRELADFYGQAESRGLKKLLLPILYASVAGLEEGSPDELLAVCARTQYFDWTALRLADPESERYRTAVNAITSVLVERWEEMRLIESESEKSRSSGSSAAEWGLAEALDEIDRRLPRWLELVEDDPILRAQSTAIQGAYSARFKRVPPQKKLALEHRMLAEMIPLSNRELDYAKAYSALTIEMHPFVLAALREVGKAPEARVALHDLRNAVAIADQAIHGILDADPRTVWSHEYWAQRASLGSKFREIAEIEAGIRQFKTEGNQLVSSWVAELARLDEPEQDRGGDGEAA